MKAKRILCVLTALIMVATVFPFSVFAGSDSYNLWVGDTEVTSDNLSGTNWSYEPSTNTLTLDGFDFNRDTNENEHFFAETTIPEVENAYAAIAYLGTDEFNIYYKKDSYVEPTIDGDGGAAFAIYSLASIKISGIDKRLSVSAVAAELDYAYGIYSAGDITIDGFVVDFYSSGAEEESVAVRAMGDVTIASGSITAHGDKGIVANKVTVKDASVAQTEVRGNKCAVDATVINEIEGRGWSDYNGTKDKTLIPVNETGATYNYKRVLFKHYKHYDLWVGDTEVVEDNLSGDGWSFNEDNNTLTLDNFKYYGDGHAFIRQNGEGAEENNAQAGITYLGERELTIALPNGTFSEIKPSNSNGLKHSFGIYSAASVAFSDIGKLNVESYDSEDGDSIAIACEKTVKFDGAEITCIGGNAENFSFGAFAADEFVIEGGVNTASGGNSNSMSSAGISAGTINLSYSYLKATGGDASVNSSGIIFSEEARFEGCSAELEGSSYGISGSFDSELYISNNVSGFSAKGDVMAIGTGFEDFDEFIELHNDVDGRGWDDPNSLQDYTVIEIADGVPYDFSYKMVEFHEHDFDEETEADAYKKSDATCTTPKTYYKSCSICGKASTDDTFTVGEANGHAFTAKRATATYLVHEANCTEPATYYFSCANCDAKGTETFTVGEPNDHVFTAKRATATYLVHEANCTEPAEYYYSCANCDAKGTETFTVGEPNGHDFTEKRTTSAYFVHEANCTEPAEYYFSCANCDAKGTETFTFGSENGHEMGEWETTKEPTCTEAGSKIKKCANCDYFEEGTIDALGHNYEAKVTPATCDAAGFTTYVCTVCGDNYVSDDPDEIVPPLGHEWDDGKVTKAPTESAEGERTFKCKTCGETKTVSIPKLAPKKEAKQTGDNVATIIFIASLAVISGAAVFIGKKKVFDK